MTDPSKVLVISGCGHWWRESRPEGLIVDPDQPRVCVLCGPTHRSAVGTSDQGLGMFRVVYVDGYDQAAGL